MLMTAKALGLAALLVLGGNTQEQNKEWAARVSARLTHANSFDQHVVPSHLSGVTGVSFRIGGDGRATDMHIVHESGNAWLDNRAIAKVRMIGRLPDAPEDVRNRVILALIEHGHIDTKYGRVTIKDARGKAIDSFRAESKRLAEAGIESTILGAS